MTRHIALMRGINVGGRNRLPMAELRTIFVDSGAESVRTYIQSGNVVFEAPAESASQVIERTSAAIQSECGLDVPIVLRTSAEYSEAMSRNPFLLEGCDPSTLHIGFLDEHPDPDDVAALDPSRSDVDRFHVSGREVYLHLPDGMARTRIGTAYFDRALRRVLTIRNWRTATRLLEMLGD